MKVYYHASGWENYESILVNGLVPGGDGLVYLADSVDNALKFVAGRLDARTGGDVAVFGVRIHKNEEKNISETYDHSEMFFKCKAWGYRGVIPPAMLGRCVRVHFDKKAGE